MKLEVAKTLLQQAFPEANIEQSDEMVSFNLADSVEINGTKYQKGAFVCILLEKNRQSIFQVCPPKKTTKIELKRIVK